MSFLGNALGPILGVAGSLFGNKQQADYNSAAAAQANEWNKENYQHRYQWSVDDMRKSGLNPILAATNGISGSIAGASASSIQALDYGASVSSGMQATSSAGQAKAAKKQADTAAAVGASTAYRNEQEGNFLTNKNNGQVIENGIMANDLNLKEQTYEQRLATERKTMELNLANLERLGMLYDAQTLQAIAGANNSNSSAAYNSELSRGARIDNDAVENIGGRYGANAIGQIAGQLLRNRK
jgi:hypothetical protein